MMYWIFYEITAIIQAKGNPWLEDHFFDSNTICNNWFLGQTKMYACYLLFLTQNEFLTLFILRIRTTFQQLHSQCLRRNLQLWMIPLSYDLHLQLWMIPLSNDLHLQSWMIPLSYNLHLQSWMIPFSYDLHLQSWMIPLSYDLHLQSWMIPFCANMLAVSGKN